MSSPGYLLLVVRALAGELFLAALVFVSYGLAARIVPRARIVTRLCALAAVQLWLLTFLFHALLPGGWFRPASACAAVLLLSLAVRAGGFTPAAWMAAMRRDVAAAACLGRQLARGRYRWFTLFFVAASALLAARVLVLPYLGWDTITYHAVRAGMWAQRGAPIEFHGPGAFGSNYQYRPVGGDLLASWPMMFLGSDALAAFTDVLSWAVLGLAAVGLAIELRVRSSFRWAGAAYVLSIPSVSRAVGSGYIENWLTAATLLSLLFGIRGLRRGSAGCWFLSFAMAGLVAGMKETGMPVAAALAACLVVGAWIVGRRWPGTGRIVIGALLVIGPALPAMLWNIGRMGYPLGPYPIKLFGLALGNVSPTVLWHEICPRLQLSDPGLEWVVLRDLFRFPTADGLGLSALTVLPVILAFFSAARVLRRHPAGGLLVLACILAVVVPFASPVLRLTRFLWADSNARFLLLPAVLAVLLSLEWCRPSSHLARLYTLYLLLGMVLQLAGAALSGWARFEWIGLPVAAGLLLVAAAGLWRLVRKGWGRATAGALVLGLPVAGLPFLRLCQERIRYDAVAESRVLHDFPRYWGPAASVVDQPRRPLTIAVTAGPHQNFDNWFLYYFLGRNLQNTLVHVPVMSDGRVVDFVNVADVLPGSDRDSWLGRIRRAGVSHVMSFRPQSLELDWLEEDDGAFRRVEGDGEGWGLYEVRPPGAAPDQRTGR